VLSDRLSCRVGHLQFPLYRSKDEGKRAIAFFEELKQAKHEKRPLRSTAGSDKAGQAKSKLRDESHSVDDDDEDDKYKRTRRRSRRTRKPPKGTNNVVAHPSLEVLVNREYRPHPASAGKATTTKPHDAPMKKRDLYFSLRTGMVSSQAAAAVVGRVTVVNWENEVVYDNFVQVPAGTVVVDYRTAHTGCTADRLASPPAIPIESVRRHVSAILKGKILIGHGLEVDLATLGITHPWSDVRDTAVYAPYMQEVTDSLTVMLLPRQLTDLLVIMLQRHPSSVQECGPVEEAVACLELYKNARTAWETELMKVVQQKERQRHAVMNMRHSSLGVAWSPDHGPHPLRSSIHLSAIQEGEEKLYPHHYDPDAGGYPAGLPWANTTGYHVANAGSISPDHSFPPQHHQGYDSHYAAFSDSGSYVSEQSGSFSMTSSITSTGSPYQVVVPGHSGRVARIENMPQGIGYRGDLTTGANESHASGPHPLGAAPVPFQPELFPSSSPVHQDHSAHYGRRPSVYSTSEGGSSVSLSATEGSHSILSASRNSFSSVGYASSEQTSLGHSSLPWKPTTSADSPLDWAEQRANSSSPSRSLPVVQHDFASSDIVGDDMSAHLPSSLLLDIANDNTPVQSGARTNVGAGDVDETALASRSGSWFGSDRPETLLHPDSELATNLALSPKSNASNMSPSALPPPGFETPPAMDLEHHLQSLQISGPNLSGAEPHVEATAEPLPISDTGVKEEGWLSELLDI
jgi:RNA exonuclease 4